MTHGERTMVMPTWTVRFDGVPTKVEPAPLLGQHITQVLSDWLGRDGAAVADDAESIATMNIDELKKANDP